MNAELIELLRQNYIAYFRLFGGQHGIRFHEDEEVAWIIANGPPGNHILRADFTAKGAEKRIDALLREIAGQTGGIRWLLFPGDRPQNLGERLEQRGLTKGRGEQWMFGSVQKLSEQRAPTTLQIEAVASRQALRAWWTASARGFGTTQRAAQAWFDAYRRHGFGADRYAVPYIAKVGRQCVASATLILDGGIAGIYDVSTIPSMRGQGYGSALVRNLMAEARQRGYVYAGLQTTDAVPFYRRQGFEVGFREREYFWAKEA